METPLLGVQRGWEIVTPLLGAQRGRNLTTPFPCSKRGCPAADYDKKGVTNAW